MTIRNTTNRSNRPKRVPVSGRRDILTVEGKDPSYVYRWVNDVEGRIDMFKDGGYEVVTHDVKVGEKDVDSSKGTGSVVTKNVGAGTTAVLMRIKKEWYEEDQKAKQDEVNRSEEDMRRELNKRDDGRYGSVKIS